MKSTRQSETSAKVDALVAERIRHFRTDRGFTQSALAQALGLSYQQLQKYESDSNRVSAGKLYEIAKFLDVPIDEFFAGTKETEVTASPEMNSDVTDLNDDFQNIDKREVRAAISGLVKSLRDNGV